jgi:hypothetical protein
MSDVALIKTPALNYFGYFSGEVSPQSRLFRLRNSEVGKDIAAALLEMDFFPHDATDSPKL